ncbi:MAG: dTDP-4-dehydrorhamnose 3,5-epimerase family protein [Vicingaceae bacterium]
MKFTETKIAGCYEIDLFHFRDKRGSFTKTFQKDSFEEQGLDFRFEESFFSTNSKSVLRGMHFQVPPNDHSKLVYAASRRILDVLLDVRKASPTFGKFVSIEMSFQNHKAIYMPKGIAHGFYCITESTMVYLTSTQQNRESERGIHWESFGFKWPNSQPIISERDSGFPKLKDFNSPFE